MTSKESDTVEGDITKEDIKALCEQQEQLDKRVSSLVDELNPTLTFKPANFRRDLRSLAERISNIEGKVNILLILLPAMFTLIATILGILVL